MAHRRGVSAGLVRRPVRRLAQHYRDVIVAATCGSARHALPLPSGYHTIRSLLGKWIVAFLRREGLAVAPEVIVTVITKTVPPPVSDIL